MLVGQSRQIPRTEGCDGSVLDPQEDAHIIGKTGERAQSRGEMVEPGNQKLRLLFLQPGMDGLDVELAGLGMNGPKIQQKG